MPKGARLDAPGALHHVMLRGIERGNIVYDDEDREDFPTRMGDQVRATRTSVYARALMDNHAHILVRSGDDGLPLFMRRFLIGYAVAFNRRHGRYGHLFQKRTEQARRRVAAVCRSEGVSENALSSGSSRRGVSAVRRRLAMELTSEMGLSLAETARQLGVSTSAVWRIIKADKS